MGSEQRPSDPRAAPDRNVWTSGAVLGMCPGGAWALRVGGEMRLDSIATWPTHKDHGRTRGVLVLARKRLVVVPVPLRACRHACTVDTTSAAA